MQYVLFWQVLLVEASPYDDQTSPQSDGHQGHHPHHLLNVPQATAHNHQTSSAHSPNYSDPLNRTKDSAGYEPAPGVVIDKSFSFFSLFQFFKHKGVQGSLSLGIVGSRLIYLL